DDHLERRRRARQDRSGTRGGGRERRRPAPHQAPPDHLAAHDAGLRGRRAPGLHLDLLRLRHTASPGRPRPARVAGVPQHRPVRRPAPLPHGHRDLGAHGGARRPVPGHGAPVRRDQGLLLALVLQGRAPAPLVAGPGGSRLVPVAPDAPVLRPVPRRAPGIGRQRMVVDAGSRALHPGALRARHRRDAQVHREQLRLLGPRGGAVHRDRRADRLDPGAHAPARAGHARRPQHPDPGDPGTAIGIAYIRAFPFDLPFVGRALTGLWIILPLALAIRRLPYTVRGSYASLLLVHRSMEEAAASVGARGLRSFADVTLPLIWRGVLVGALFSFVTSLQEASAVLFLSL